jgi:phosphoglycerate dehydrogenase-like enzyme
MVTILSCGVGWPALVELLSSRLPNGWKVVIRDPSRPLGPQLESAVVALPGNFRFDAAALAQAPALRLIQQPATGVAMIDLLAARTRGIPVCNTPSANSQAVAECTVFLMLALARRAHGAASAMRAAQVGTPLGIELASRTLGIVGKGAIGSRVADIAAAIGMKVSWVRSSNSRGDFLALLRDSDFVSVHCPLTETTRGMFDARAFEAMRPGAFLINTAPAAVIVEEPLLRALKEARLAGAAFDTFWQEPWDPTMEILQLPNFYATPHIGGTTAEAFGRTVDTVLDNITRLLDGRELLHRVA